MKLFGSSKGSRHAASAHAPGRAESGADARGAGSPQTGAGSPPQNNNDSGAQYARRDAAQPVGGGAGRASVPGGKKPGKFVRVLLIVLAAIAVLAVAATAYWLIAVRPPSVNTGGTGVGKKTSSGTSGASSEETSSGVAPEGATRDSAKFTFVLVGMDDGNGNTDTIMVATFDSTNRKLNVVSVPRDTLVNVSWYTKKVNSLYSNGGIDRLKSGLADILGYELDHYVIVDLNAFVDLVDAIGGVTFDVPQDMDYDDPAQDLYIHVKAGEQKLDGKTAMGVVRFRHGYADADIGRIRTQQAFVKTALQQIISNAGSISISTLAKIFINDVKTDLTYGNVIWFGKELLKMSTDDITFNMLPGNIGDSVNGNSYVTIYVNKWLAMVNEYLNPYDKDITVSDVNILTRNDAGELYSTSGNYAGDPSWGSGGGGGGSTSGSTSESSSSKTSSESSSESAPASSSEASSSGASSENSSGSSSSSPSSSSPSSSAPSSSETSSAASSETSSAASSETSSETSSGTSSAGSSESSSGGSETGGTETGGGAGSAAA